MKTINEYPPLTTTLISVRPATFNDVGIIHDFVNSLEETILDYNRFRTIFSHNLTNPGIHYLVAEFDGMVIGFVSCHVQYLLHHCGKVGEIQELYVKPEYRNQRVGHHLLATLNTLAVQEGLVNLEVTTNQKRQNTVRFYERELFKLTHYKLIKPIIHK